ncbi:uncharacterized protein EV422DRAFT_565359 [Fimicolochytrium jonesii]|uniref:uncharacterized protein n=1 Tax=Fimicolochytrium jonesii TaxID=1396493 RepID=UPI0022FDB71D|nr:uncharacterized protein EV422DRAFT_565359 [Fimicolochytrium jonesii]KAI8823409.1 hypothetical protein EV422DRAFT_565359 [Fimicolochytrium jonesii]
MPTPTATSATSTAANAPTSPTAPLDDDEGNDYECNVCLEVASSPVVTLCGHLFCWPCLHYWMQTRSAFAKACPVCKAKVEQDKIIPIYGRGREAEDPRLKVIPKRPTAAAPPQVTRYGGGWQGFGGGGPTGNGVTVGLGIFPSLFGVHFSVGTQMGGVAGQRPAPDAFQPGSFVSRLFMMIGILSMLAIILS